MWSQPAGSRVWIRPVKWAKPANGTEAPPVGSMWQFSRRTPGTGQTRIVIYVIWWRWKKNTIIIIHSINYMNVKLSKWFSGISSFSFSIRAASFGLLNDSSKKACKSFILLFPCTTHFRVCTALKSVRSCFCELDSDNNPKMLYTESFNAHQSTAPLIIL